MNVRLYVNGIEQERPRGPVSIRVKHRCQHEAVLWYTSEEVANVERARQAAQACAVCRERPKSDADRAKVAEMARIRRAKRNSTR